MDLKLRRPWCVLALAALFAPACLGQAAGAAVPLPPPSLDGGMSLEQTLQQRRSVRAFAAAPLSLPQVAQLLWAAQGVTNPHGLRTAPSAGALHALDVYLLALRVDNLAPGLYRYAPAPHTLTPLTRADPRAALAEAVPGQAWMRDAPAVLLVTGVVARMAPKYGVRAARYVHIETGHAAQNIYLQATALGLATVLVGAFDDDRLHAALGLPDGHAPLALMPVGHAR